MEQASPADRKEARDMAKQVKFEKRHYEFMARVIFSIGNDAARHQAAEAFAHTLALTNPNFSKDLFISACKMGV